MTIEEKALALEDFCDSRPACGGCPLGAAVQPCEACFTYGADIERNYNIVFGEATPCIKDSGNRTEFESGAVRDIQEGKGRCDLLPLDVVAQALGDRNGVDAILYNISLFHLTGDANNLHYALGCFNGFDTPQTMLLEVAIHFEDGAKKYGERNWEKGIPVSRYIDSAVRHYLKWLRGDTDERHDRAFCWNILCAIWTCKHKPELNEYKTTEV